MRHAKWAAVLWCVLAASVSAAAEVQPAMEGPEGRRAFDDLASFYQDATHVPPYREALSQLGASDEAVRRGAGQYLLALIRQSVADESNGRAPWKSLPFFGGGAECAAIEFRKTMVADFGVRACTVEALPAALWLVEEDALVSSQIAGVDVLCAVKDPASEALFSAILARPHPNEAVTVAVLREIGKRRLTRFAPDLRRLSCHYRAFVRRTAREVAELLGIQDLPAYDPEKAFTPWLVEQLDLIRQMVYEEIPATASWVTVEYTDPDRQVDGVPRTAKFGGWLLSEDETNYRIMDWLARVRLWAKKDTKVSPRTWTDEMTVLLAIRAKGGPRDAMQVLSSGGSLTGQFESRNLSLPEALVAAWAYERGDLKSAAAILFPRLDNVPDDRWLVGIARTLLGHDYHLQMLDAFCRDRDYPAAIALAKHLSKPLFDGYYYQPRAKELAAQLARRGEDFKTFVLPTREAWDEQKKGMTRKEQVRFLAERLRLLNCIQCFQPGTVNYTDNQHAASESASRQAYAARGEKAVAVVNPFVELEAMWLAPAELEVLVPFLADEDFMPTYGFWRNFHPSRDLHRVNRAVTRIVNDAVGYERIDLDKYQGMDEEGRKAYVEELLGWCRDNRGKTRVQVLLEVLASTSDGTQWRTAARELTSQKVMEALPILVKRFENFPQQRGSIVQYCYRMDVSEIVPAARRWIGCGDDAAQFWAALILLTYGDTAWDEGLDTLKSLIEKDREREWLRKAVEPLCRTRREACLRLACSIFDRAEGERPVLGGERALRALFLAGRQECLDWMLVRLDSDKATGSSIGATVDGKACSRAETESDEVADIVVTWRNDGSRYEAFVTDEERVRRRAELKAWLREQFNHIKAGKKSEIAEEPPLPWPQ